VKRKASAELDCRRCGACCVNPPPNRDAEFPWWVEIADGDAIRDNAALASLVIHDPEGVPHLRLLPNGRCVALRGTPGRVTTCSIYDDRPSPCRTVQPGDEMCKLYRFAHGVA
jgi:Fe-S-cluster containining protein